MTQTMTAPTVRPFGKLHDGRAGHHSSHGRGEVRGRLRPEDPSDAGEWGRGQRAVL